MGFIRFAELTKLPQTFRLERHPLIGGILGHLSGVFDFGHQPRGGFIKAVGTIGVVVQKLRKGGKTQ
jgi:hypothetical protein